MMVAVVVVAVVIVDMVAVIVVTAVVRMAVVLVSLSVPVVEGIVTVVVLRRCRIQEKARNEEGCGNGKDDLFRHVFHVKCQ